MKCSHCHSENRDGIQFCEECGAKLEIECPSCKTKIPPGKKFCGKCGSALMQISDPPHTPNNNAAPNVPLQHAAVSDENFVPSEGERKFVTILFSDISGYTAMSERLDPETVREITGRVFAKISEIAAKYEGFIEKFIGDAAMAVFGATKSHEDDPIRAVKAAVDIHKSVESINSEYRDTIQQSLAMHSGINTGLVVTGKIDMEKGTHGLSGDPINIAARLSGLGEKGDILVGPDTYAQAEGFFDFEKLAPRTLKGKAKPVQIYRLITQKERPRKIHRLQGVRARLIGRKVEMTQLESALKNLQNGSGSIFAVYGAAGTGKSRLIEEFKASVDPAQIQWIEGFAYPFTQNVPYYPLVNLLSNVFQIKESDPQSAVKEKIETGLKTLIDPNLDLIPYIGGLFSLPYNEIENVSPEFWMSQVEKATRILLSAIGHSGPTIVCLEDLHWGDPSFLKLIRAILGDTRDPIMFLCVYRPLVTLFSSHQVKCMVSPYHEIELKDLSASDSQDMVESLLNTSDVPSELHQFIQNKIEGNPFYLEELVNSLMETGILIADDNGWHMTKTVAESEISSTIHGVIAARLDRLQRKTKRILQEASVIGRSFYFDILKRVTDLSENIEQHLSGLERLDLIKARSFEPDLEYIFKHALTQEVVYNGLLIKERLKIHARIARVIEQLFADRLPEFYETLAFHYKRSHSIPAAVDYLMKAGEKSLKRYAVQEAHEYYNDAYRLMMDNPAFMKDHQDLFYHLLNKWSLVYYYRGDFKEQTGLLKSHQPEAEKIKSPEIKAMFYGWLGWVLMFRKELEESYRYLRKALSLGLEIGNQKILGYAYTWLIWLCGSMDRYEEAYSYWEKAIEIAKTIESDQYLYFKSLGGISHITMYSGRKAKACYDAGIKVLSFGQKHSNTRSQVVGHICIGHSHASDGNHQAALKSYIKALQIATDPFYTEWARVLVGISYFMLGDLTKAEEALTKVAAYIEACGCETMSSATYPLLGAIMVGKGKMSEGLDMILQAYRMDQEKKWGFGIATGEYTLAKLYFQIAQGKEKPKMTVLMKNFSFVMKNVPFALRKAEEYFRKAIATSKKYRTQGLLGQSYYDLGQLYLLKNKKSLAKACFSYAEDVFKELEAAKYSANARRMLRSLE
jgi:predicted ATPase/class 3 adenylate cyclase